MAYTVAFAHPGKLNPMAEVLTSRTNPRVKQLRAAFAGQPRLASGLIAIEGPHLLEEALTTNQAIKTIFLSERTPTPLNLPAGIEILRLASDVFASVTDTQSPQGIAALLVPPTGSLDSMFTRIPLILVAVALQDPGNLGTLIRSAVAFAATGILLTPGTVNPFNPKVIRASAGAIFRIPIAPITLESLPTNLQLLATVPGYATPIHTVDLIRPTAILLGNEGAGLPPEWLAAATQRVTIPTPGPVESLNAAVAASILLYEAARQRQG